MHDDVSNHQPHDCLLNRLSRRRSKKTSKLHVNGLCTVNSPHKWPVTRKMFPFDDVIKAGPLKLKRTPLPYHRIQWHKIRKRSRPSDWRIRKVVFRRTQWIIFPKDVILSWRLKSPLFDYLFNSLLSLRALLVFVRRIHWPSVDYFHKRTIMLKAMWGNPPVTGWFRSQRASNAEIISMPWRQYGWLPRRQYHTCIIHKLFVLGAVHFLCNQMLLLARCKVQMRPK